MTKIYTNIMRKHSIALLLTATLLASCGGSRKGAVADNRYRRAPILEVTAEELSNDSALIDATAQMLVGKQEEAAEGYRALLKRSPGYAPAHYGLGRLYLASGWMDSALYHTRMACRQDGDNRWYRIQLARIYEQMRDGKNLTATWEELVKRYPDETEFYYNLSNAYLLNNNVPSSIEVLDRVSESPRPCRCRSRSYGMPSTSPTRPGRSLRSWRRRCLRSRATAPYWPRAS